jgi:hypothetical protein
MTRVAAISGGAVPARRGGRAGGFAPLAGTDGTAMAPAAVAVAPAGLLALQEAVAVRPDPERARRRASAALDELRGLQLEMLSGAVDPDRLARLAALADGAGSGAEPALEAVLQEVSLRARLEIARRRVASGSNA